MQGRNQKSSYPDGMKHSWGTWPFELRLSESRSEIREANSGVYRQYRLQNLESKFSKLIDVFRMSSLA
jgi:hypothetical protein